MKMWQTSWLVVFGCSFAFAAQPSVAPAQVSDSIWKIDPLQVHSSMNPLPIFELIRPDTLPPIALVGVLAEASKQWREMPFPTSEAPGKDMTPESKGAVVESWAKAFYERGYNVLSQETSEGLPVWPTEVNDTFLSAIAAAQSAYGLPFDNKVGSYLRTNFNADPLQTANEFDTWSQTVDKATRAAWDSGYRHVVVVNIPSFTLHAIDLWTGETVLESRVIIGLPSRKTPRFNTNIVGLKYNPDWSPPPSLLARGRHYMPPGPANPLGMLRFSTDNASHIYLHDTDEHELFEETNRARSSGCIRVQRWRELAALISGQTEEDIDDKVSTRRTYNETIEPTLVVISYSLVDVVANSAGRYVDVYGLGPLHPFPPLEAEAGAGRVVAP